MEETVTARPDGLQPARDLDLPDLPGLPDLPDLPDLLDVPGPWLEAIAENLLIVEPPWRRLCDVVRDVVVLAAVSRGVSAQLVPLMSAILHQPSPHKACMSGVHTKPNGDTGKKVTVAELKEACRAQGLRVSGTSAVLKARLHAEERFHREQEMKQVGERLRHCGLGAALCARAAAEHRYVLPAFSANALRASMALPPLPDLGCTVDASRPMTHAGIVMEAIGTYGSARAVAAEVARRKEEAAAEAALRVLRAMQEQDARRGELTAALSARGLVLRPDSKLCEAYVIGSAGMLTLQQVVDATEEISFFYKHTRYSSILRARRVRHSFDRDFDRDFDREFGSARYWRARDRYRNGEDGEDEGHDDDDNDDDLTEREQREDAVRAEAKRTALSEWLKHEGFTITQIAIGSAQAASFEELSQRLPTRLPRSLLPTVRAMMIATKPKVKEHEIE